MPNLRVFRASVIALALLAMAPNAEAQDVEGNVLALQGDDVVVDLGANRGVAVGDIVEVWRPLRLRHPVTGATIVDRFRIARLKIVQVRPAVAIARLEGAADRPLSAADIVVAVQRDSPPVAPVAPVAPKPQQPPRDEEKGRPAPKVEGTTVTTTTTVTAPGSRQKVASVESEAKEIHELLLSLHGTPPTQRAAAYKAYVLAHPQSAHVKLLWDEAALLERIVVHDRETAEKRRTVPKVVGFVPPRAATANVPLRIGLELAMARGAVFHARRRGEPGFTSTAMTESGPSYFATTVPATAMKEGVLEYFIESTDAEGDVRSAAGSAQSPLALEIENALPEEARGREATHRAVTASVFTDYASFNGTKTNDFVWQSEAMLGVRFHDVGLRALRSGFGAYRGRGGTLIDLDERQLAGRNVGLTYGHLELELGLTEVLSLAARAIVGLRDQGVNGGAQGFIRFGSDRKTNLLFGGEVLGGIGLRGITQLEWQMWPRFPIILRSEVTNQPAGVSTSASGTSPVSTGQGDVGIRSIAQIGYRLVPRLTVAVRGSFQARTINHAGPGAGAAVSYEW